MLSSLKSMPSCNLRVNPLRCCPRLGLTALTAGPRPSNRVQQRKSDNKKARTISNSVEASVDPQVEKLLNDRLIPLVRVKRIEELVNPFVKFEREEELLKTQLFSLSPVELNQPRLFGNNNPIVRVSLQELEQLVNGRLNSLIGPALKKVLEKVAQKYTEAAQKHAEDTTAIITAVPGLTEWFLSHDLDDITKTNLPAILFWCVRWLKPEDIAKALAYLKGLYSTDMSSWEDLTCHPEALLVALPCFTTKSSQYISLFERGQYFTLSPVAKPKAARLFMKISKARWREAIERQQNSSRSKWTESAAEFLRIEWTKP